MHPVWSWLYEHQEKKCKGELQEAKHNVLIGEDGKEQELHCSIQEILVLDKQRYNVCLRE